MDPFDRSDRPRWQADAPAPPPATDGLQAAHLRTLRQLLLDGRSATATLEHWCTMHALARPARVRALALPGTGTAAPAAVREALQPSAALMLRHRRVQLTCGTRVLSVADNWYLPALLSPDMNTRLDNSDEPFGRVVSPLVFRRMTLHDETFWPPHVDQDGRIVLQMHALLLDPQQRAFSYVVERYRDDVLP